MSGPPPGAESGGERTPLYTHSSSVKTEKRALTLILVQFGQNSTFLWRLIRAYCDVHDISATLEEKKTTAETGNGLNLHCVVPRLPHDALRLGDARASVVDPQRILGNGFKTTWNRQDQRPPQPSLAHVGANKSHSLDCITQKSLL